ncbi:MAG: hypothetical protein D5S03_06600 [Desulfonatronospira sp. MSAO_Bac3]|nr:MAG: hypothetical protein D5S03_06600 [Desulfonatronospira sp. MSAO_Bac3]
MKAEDRCNCKKSFLQLQGSGDRGQESIKTKSYELVLLLNCSQSDFLQAHQDRLRKKRGKRRMNQACEQLGRLEAGPTFTPGGFIGNVPPG